ncbi:hypothetical protein CH63R_11363 [Colletotrichum higginsianum IMI 349063]|uniref:Uncharacterized protein n=2 Tax=Colletotrichum higginsianum TaxID=80884 RepID=A0A1B7XY36_COLHI|nr:hypothetical protein CH63R_11363 [Colletotrichum higginsianum IMI 349063]OBR04660.1 hypothetical protein CH63R_11363 [Colletotrichum higginsianum IMI 349063]
MLAVFIAAGQPISNGSTAAKPELEPNADDFDAEITSHTQAVNARSIAITINSSSNSGDGIFRSNQRHSESSSAAAQLQYYNNETALPRRSRQLLAKDYKISHKEKPGENTFLYIGSGCFFFAGLPLYLRSITPSVPASTPPRRAPKNDQEEKKPTRKRKRSSGVSGFTDPDFKPTARGNWVYPAISDYIPKQAQIDALTKAVAVFNNDKSEAFMSDWDKVRVMKALHARPTVSQRRGDLSFYGQCRRFRDAVKAGQEPVFLDAVTATLSTTWPPGRVGNRHPQVDRSNPILHVARFRRRSTQSKNRHAAEESKAQEIPETPEAPKVKVPKVTLALGSGHGGGRYSAPSRGSTADGTSYRRRNPTTHPARGTNGFECKIPSLSLSLSVSPLFHDASSEKYDNMTSSEENAKCIEELRDLVDGYAWCVLETDAPDWYMCPIYKTILGKKMHSKRLAQQHPSISHPISSEPYDES